MCSAVFSRVGRKLLHPALESATAYAQFEGGLDGDRHKALLWRRSQEGYSLIHGSRDPQTPLGASAPAGATQYIDLWAHRGSAGGGGLYVLAGHLAGRHLAALGG